jgi:hypothetical protein
VEPDGRWSLLTSLATTHRRVWTTGVNARKIQSDSARAIGGGVEEGNMSEIQGWIIIALVVIVIFSQWTIASRRS